LADGVDGAGVVDGEDLAVGEFVHVQFGIQCWFWVLKQ
jgi:hypothetical protein